MICLLASREKTYVGKPVGEPVGIDVDSVGTAVAPFIEIDVRKVKNVVYNKKFHSTYSSSYHIGHTMSYVY